jgi:hypothetical protein
LDGRTFFPFLPGLCPVRIAGKWSGKSFRFAGCSKPFRYSRGAMHFNEQSKPAYVMIIRAKLKAQRGKRLTGSMRSATTKLSKCTRNGASGQWKSSARNWKNRETSTPIGGGSFSVLWVIGLIWGERIQSPHTQHRRVGTQIHNLTERPGQPPLKKCDVNKSALTD